MVSQFFALLVVAHCAIHAAQSINLVQQEKPQNGAESGAAIASSFDGEFPGPQQKRYIREPLRFGKRFSPSERQFQFGVSNGGGGGLINPFLYEAYRSEGFQPFQRK